jgi:hypothetical protein
MTVSQKVPISIEKVSSTGNGFPFEVLEATVL